MADFYIIPRNTKEQDIKKAIQYLQFETERGENK